MYAPILLAALIGWTIGVLLDAYIGFGPVQMRIILPILAVALHLWYKHRKKKEKEEEEKETGRDYWNRW
ncbi:MAG: hypothetical protein E7457_04035 [Ruminococcaceae bacterium]|nr:hypothetical protein [Oscillospiraceae bacterium]